MAQGLEIEIGANTRKLTAGLKEAEGKLRGFSSSPAISGIGTAIAGAFSIGALSAFSKQVFNATAEFQKFGAVLGNTLGSAALANIQLKQIAEFAAKTPFGINELTGAFVKLANAGFKPTGEQMTKLGDLASSTGKSFDQLAEAILDAQSGEFERLKEFGIRAKDAGDKVIFTYKGVQTQTEKTAGAIREYITSLGGAEGVSGSMAVISQTLTGKISNLGDNWDQMLVSVGSNTTGVFSGAIDIISKAISKVTQFNNELNIADKYNLKGDGLEKFNRGLNPFASKGATSKELAVAGIQMAQEKVGAFVQKAVEGAKSAKDFSAAISQLAKESKSLVFFGEQKKGEKLGVIDQYLQGINALREAQKNFINKGKDVESNFGTAGKTKKKGLTDAQREGLEQQKRFAEYKVEGNAFAGKLIIDSIERNAEAEIAAIRKASEEIASIVSVEDPLAKVFADRDKSAVGAMTTPFQDLKIALSEDILPQIEDNFKIFFDDVLMKGELSFKTLGESIKNTFASVLSSEATKGLMNLVTKGGKDGSSLLQSAVGIFGKGAGASAGATAGKAGSLASVAASTGGFLGLGAGLGGGGAESVAKVASKGFGKALSSILPYAGIALAGASLLGGIFKKKSRDPERPAGAPSTAYYTPPGTAGHIVVSGVLRVSGQDLVAVLSNTQNMNNRFGG